MEKEKELDAVQCITMSPPAEHLPETRGKLLTSVVELFLKSYILTTGWRRVVKRFRIYLNRVGTSNMETYLCRYNRLAFRLHF